MSENQETRSRQRFSNFKKALKRYEEATSSDLSDLEKEGLIQRFEYSFELAWKCLQDLLYERGYSDVRGPRPVIEKAFQDGIISDGPLWLQMLQSRNETVHLYDEKTFERISEKVKSEYFSALKKFESEFSP